MHDVLTTMSSAYAAFKRARETAKQIENAELSMAIADGMEALADARMEVADLKNRIRELEQEIHQLQSGDPCPRCHGPGWGLAESSPALGFGDMGVTERIYRCSDCGLEEKKVVTD